MKRFYNCHSATHSHNNAQVIVRSNMQHSGHFGVHIRNSHTPGSAGIYIETVEHAEALIKALQDAISTQLYTEEALDARNVHSNTLSELDKDTQRSKLRRQCHTDRLKDSLQAALDWIDAVPQDTVLPVMPGFDRDYVNGVLHDCD